MLTRLIRAQLIIFAIASVIGVSAMVFTYMQAPTLLGIGRMTVTVELPATGGLYQFSNVTYRGVQVGKVTDVSPTRDGATATLSLSTDHDIPADVHADVRSVSAVGEQYVDLRPQDGPASPDGPLLAEGATIPRDRTSIPQAVGPMLDRISGLLEGIPEDNISALLDESFKAFDGSGFDMGSLVESGATLARDAKDTAEQTRALTDDSRPLLEGQQSSADDIRTWARSLAGITDQFVDNDEQLRTVFSTGPDALDEASRLMDAVKPTLPVLLANLSSLGRVGITYNPSLEQLMVLFPPYIAATQTVGVARNNPTGMPVGDFTLTLNDPPACTVGFLPPSTWRSPEDLTEVDTPDGLYCKLPQDSPIGVRGVRNFPCMGKPGKRAPTVEICNSDKPFEPLAMRQHALGPYPFDPNLVSQGIPPDERVRRDENLHAPIAGTPMPPAGPGTVPSEAAMPPLPLPGSPIPPAPGNAPQQPVASATYDPESGQYVGPDGHIYRQSDLGTAAGTRTWQNMVAPPVP